MLHGRTSLPGKNCCLASGSRILNTIISKEDRALKTLLIPILLTNTFSILVSLFQPCIILQLQVEEKISPTSRASALKNQAYLPGSFTMHSPTRNYIAL